MLYRLLRPLLFRLDAETAHRLGLAVARRIAAHPRLASLIRRLLARPARTPVHVAGLDFPNPIGLAAGLDKNAEAPLAWWAFGFGFAELGTVTPRPQPGNPRPRLFRFPRMRALVNRMGFNNDGAEVVAERLRRQVAQGQRPPFPIGISIGKNATTPLHAAADDYTAAARRLAPWADFITINISSPNTADLRTLQNAADVTRLVEAVRRSSGGKPVFVKLAPEVEGIALASVLDTCVAAGAAGVIATNSLATAGRPDFPEGGLSGWPLRALALRRVAEIRRHAGNHVAVIGCGGIDDAASAQAMLDAGADLLQLYTGLIYEGPFLPARLSRAIRCDEPRAT
jgi:dihydroorotate dehydrogenase